MLAVVTYDVVCAEMANATFVPVDYILQRGQTVKCFSLLVKAMHARNMICPDDWAFSEGETEADAEARARDAEAQTGYVGATVLEPITGAYFQPVAVLDFAALYPSVIRAHTFCPSTLVLDARYGGTAGVEYTDVAVGEDCAHKFARVEDAVTPGLLSQLAVFRSKAKADMASAHKAGDAAAAALYDGKQKAYKVTMNSVRARDSPELITHATADETADRLLTPAPLAIFSKFLRLIHTYIHFIGADVRSLRGHEGLYAMQGGGRQHDGDRASDDRQDEGDSGEPGSHGGVRCDPPHCRRIPA